ncbi:hypothetical protein QN277_012514 [Acacia crassicarpa]|uniref:Uncharacterized protein n=1 Tax=Acacia crassicarpa TaxID=499986 RepID=A0AAE1N1I0_9FABA|nr:hypothetical protein QN277_012514 [Acacia crassicarpa]
MVCSFAFFSNGGLFIIAFVRYQNYNSVQTEQALEKPHQRKGLEENQTKKKKRLALPSDTLRDESKK